MNLCYLVLGGLRPDALDLISPSTHAAGPQDKGMCSCGIRSEVRGITPPTQWPTYALRPSPPPLPPLRTRAAGIYQRRDHLLKIYLHCLSMTRVSSFVPPLMQYLSTLASLYSLTSRNVRSPGDRGRCAPTKIMRSTFAILTRSFYLYSHGSLGNPIYSMRD